MDPATQDAQLRQAAFDHVNRLATLRGGILESADLALGFEFAGDRIPLINPQRGIFKPRQMEHLLSIKTVFPRRGARVWYDDAHLIGIDPDYRIHVSDRLLEIHDGPFLELGLKGIVGQVIQLPRRFEDRPDGDRLALRFEQFKKSA
jgi:hypothetical protein